MSSIAGVDFSYGCPAICVYNPAWGEFKFENCKVFYLITVKKYSGQKGANIYGMNPPLHDSQEERFQHILDWASAILTKFQVKRVCLEGYAMGSKNGRVFDIAENTSLLKNFMWRNKIDFITPTPTQLKKFYTGKGNASKELMCNTFLEETECFIHIDIGCGKIDDKPANDIIDAYALTKYMRSV